MRPPAEVGGQRQLARKIGKPAVAREALAAGRKWLVPRWPAQHRHAGRKTGAKLLQPARALRRPWFVLGRAHEPHVLRTAAIDRLDDGGEGEARRNRLARGEQNS